MAELEKLGSKFRVAQRIAKDPRFDRLPCTHKGTYADDCLVNRVTQVNLIVSKIKLQLRIYSVFRDIMKSLE